MKRKNEGIGIGRWKMRIDKRMLEDIPAWLAKQDDIPGGWLYIGDEKERYLLGQPGRRNMLVFGVNPSTASAGENNLDPTIKRVASLVGYEVISMKDLDGFSDETKEIVERMVR